MALVTTSNVLAFAVPAAQLINEVAGFTAFPPMKAASTILLAILEIVQTIQHHQRECTALADLCAGHLRTIHKAMKGKWDNAPRELLDNIADFERTLAGLQQDLRTHARETWVDIVFRNGRMDKILSIYNLKVTKAVQDFQMVAIVQIQHNVRQIYVAVSPTDGTPGMQISQVVTGPVSTTIYFFDKSQPYYEFSNYSQHPVEHNGKSYPTAVHLFQAHKFLDTSADIAESIRVQATPKDAVDEASRHSYAQRTDWRSVNREYMDLVLDAKFAQHPALRETLLATGDKELVEASPYDDFWGYGPNKNGRNEFGKCLMKLRERLRAANNLHGHSHSVRPGRGRGRKGASDDSASRLHVHAMHGQYDMHRSHSARR
ncbi:NADAR family protein [Phanerochaete sordida]|uniref:NADAR family protein n=1 Tax=Phanerochaete sordida TaxID=48140 RepID=A0A9P3GIL8_9APHY|nr:NADAR family protein [Phanerochaete sordida]